MKILLLLFGLVLAFWGLTQVIQGALGVALMVSGAVLISAAFIGSWIQESAKTASESAEAICKLLVEIRDQNKPMPPPTPPATDFDPAQVVEQMEAGRRRLKL